MKRYFLTLDELNSILKYAMEFHTHQVNGGKHRLPLVKYIDPKFDARYGHFYKVRFWGFGADYEFWQTLTMKESRFDNLHDIIMAYLNKELTEEELTTYKTKK